MDESRPRKRFGLLFRRGDHRHIRRICGSKAVQAELVKQFSAPGTQLLAALKFVADEFAATQNINAIGEGLNFLELVRNDNNRCTVRSEVPQHSEKLFHFAWRKNRRRLIEEQEIRAAASVAGMEFSAAAVAAVPVSADAGSTPSPLPTDSSAAPTVPVPTDPSSTPSPGLADGSLAPLVDSEEDPDNRGLSATTMTLLAIGLLALLTVLAAVYAARRR